MAYVHNAFPEIDIAVNSSRHGMSEKNEMRKMFMSLLNV